jgi:hypothetical protein
MRKLYSRGTAVYLVTVALLAAFQVLVNFDPATINDWRAWAIALGGGVVRQVASGAVARIAEALAGES